MLEIHDSRTHLRRNRAWNDEGVTKSSVEANCDIACDLDVLPLIITNRYFVGIVKQDVCCLEGGICEQPCRYEFSLASGGLVLELGHSTQFAIADQTFHHPTQLVVLRYVGLDENSGNIRFEANCKKNGCQMQRALAENTRLIRDRQGMEVDYSVKYVCLMLSGDPIT